MATKKADQKASQKKASGGRASQPKAATPAKRVPPAKLSPQPSLRKDADRDVDRDDAPPPPKRGVAAKSLPKRKAAPRPEAAGAPVVSPALGVAAGDLAPSFVLKDHSGTLVSSESLRGSPYILYFYPKDDTPGCTVEACGFRDFGPRFVAKGVRVLGVSPDSPETHARFRKKYGLTFALLSDPEKTLSKAYGVWVTKQNYGREYMGVERSTFFVDRAGVVRKAWRRVRVPGHVDEVVHSV